MKCEEQADPFDIFWLMQHFSIIFSFWITEARCRNDLQKPFYSSYIFFYHLKIQVLWIQTSFKKKNDIYGFWYYLYFQVWDLSTGFLRGTLNDHDDVVNWCCFSPDSTKIASCSNDLYLKVSFYNDVFFLFFMFS